MSKMENLGESPIDERVDAREPYAPPRLMPLGRLGTLTRFDVSVIVG